MNLISAIVILLYILIPIIVLTSLWRVFAKAGEPGWMVLIPICNLYVLLRIGGKPGWWLLLFFIPLVNIVVHVILSIEVGAAFGKGTGFGLGLAFFAPIFYPILAFSDASYEGAEVCD